MGLGCYATRAACMHAMLQVGAATKARPLPRTSASTNQPCLHQVLLGAGAANAGAGDGLPAAWQPGPPRAGSCPHAGPALPN